MADVDSLQIKISASSEQAASAIDKLTASLTKLKTAFNGGTKKYENLTKSLKELGDTAKGMEDSIGALAKAASAIERLSNIKNVKIPKGIGDGIRNIGLAAEMITPQAVENLDRMTRSLQRLQNVDFRGFSSGVRSINRASASGSQAAPAESGTEEVQSSTRGVRAILNGLRERVKLNIDTEALKRVADLAKTALGHLKSLGKKIRVRIEAATIGKLKESLKGIATIFKSLGRIAFYRAIRSVIKAITTAFSEGLKNAYAFSAGLSNAIDGRIATALDGLAGKATTMKNQLGAAFGSLLTAIAPIISTLISLITALATAITQLFAAFTGGTFLRAKDVSGQFADNMKAGGGAAKEWKNQLMGFDEINRLEDPSGGGGGGGGSALDVNDMFEVVAVEQAIQNFVDSLKSAIKNGEWEDVGKLLGSKINEIIDSVNWSGIGTWLGYRINGVIQSIYYTLRTIDFGKIGQDIATFVNNSLRMIDFTVWGRLLVRKLTSALDFFMGFLGDLNWGQLGEKIGGFLRGALDEASEWLSGYNWAELAEKFSDNLILFIQGLDPASLASSLNNFIGRAIEALKEFVGGVKWGEVVQELVSKLSEFFDNLSPGLGMFAKLALGIAIAVGAFKLLHGTVSTIKTVFDGAKAAIALLTSPLGLVVIAVAAAVVAGIALYKNWDKIKAKAQELWDKISETWENIKTTVSQKIDAAVEFVAKVKNDAAKWWSNVKTWWSEGKQSVEDFVVNVKDDSATWWSNVVTWWGTAKTDALDFGVKVKNDAATWWANVKDWWTATAGNLWTTLNIKIPHIEVQWKQVASLFGQSIEFPSFSIVWNARGGIVDGATLFGAGEAGKEAIIPLERNTEWIGKVASEMVGQMNQRSRYSADSSDDNEDVINAIFAVGSQIVNAIAENSSSGDVNWREVARNVTRYQNQMARAGAY